MGAWTGADLAAIVPTEAVEEALDALDAEGVYDDTRRIRKHDDDHLELPVTAVPEADVGDIVEQVDPEPKLTSLEDHLRRRGFSEQELARVPNSWAVVGDVVLVRFDDCPRREEVGEALLSLHGADTVLAREGVHGEHREPDVELVAGSGDTETVHTEHGTRYALDLSKVMFSPGNKAERVRMGEVVAEGERVLDMFAGIGYFALPMARAGADVTAIERNPAAFTYLLENTVLNGVQGRVRPFRADCRDVLAWHDDPDVDVDATAERVVMGHYDAHEYVATALAAIEPGGILHVHQVTPDAEFPDRPVERVESATAEASRPVAEVDVRTVKTYSEGVRHVVVDARVH